MKEERPHNSTYPKGGVLCSKASFVVNQTFVFQSSFVVKSRHSGSCKPLVAIVEKKMTQEFKDISIRGRLAYGMTCLEMLVEHFGIEDEFIESIVFRRIWIFTSCKDLSEWEMNINEVDPICILDPNTNLTDLTTLDLATFKKLKALYNTVPQSVLATISNVIEIGTVNIYAGVIGHSIITLTPLEEIIKIMTVLKISLPNISTFKKSTFKEFHGWGNDHPKEYYRA